MSSDISQIPSPIPEITDKRGRPLRVWIIFAGAVVIVTLIAWLYPPVREILTNGEAFRDWIGGFGRWAPVITIAYHALQIVFPTIPGLVVDISNGYLYGFWWGIVLSYIGITLGTLVALLIARRFGEALAAGVGEQYRTAFNRFRGAKQLRIFFLFLLIPGVPHDALSYVIGVTQHPFWKKVMVMLVGRLPTIIGAVALGASGQWLNPLAALGVSIILIIIIGFVFSRKIKKST